MSIRYENNYFQDPNAFSSLAMKFSDYSSPPQNFHARNISNQNGPNELSYLTPQISKKKHENLQNNSLVLSNNQSLGSHARNFKNRLFEADPTEESRKQAEKNAYRRELQIQMKADQQRKQREKQKLEEQEIQREKKFYQQVKIEAQKKQVQGQPDSYVVVRSSEAKRRKKKKRQEQLSDPHLNPELKAPSINKRGGYHNQSALDKFDSQLKNPGHGGEPESLKKSMSELEERELEVIRERNYEEERISNIIKIQEKMLKKLDGFRGEIFKVKQHLDLPSELEKVRRQLRVKPMKLDDVISIKDSELFENNSELYHLPTIPQRKRQHVPRHESTRNGESSYGQRHKSMDRTVQRAMEHHPDTGESVKKRQIKLFDRVHNDKNHESLQEQSELDKNQIVTLPVVHEKESHERNSESQLSKA